MVMVGRIQSLVALVKTSYPVVMVQTQLLVVLAQIL
jgi:hypothetical protein